MDKLYQVVPDSIIIIIRLLYSYCDSSLISKTGDWHNSKGILPSGTQLTQILFHFYLDSLDRAFEAAFPSVPYVTEVIIPFFYLK